MKKIALGVVHKLFRSDKVGTGVTGHVNGSRYVDFSLYVTVLKEFLQCQPPMAKGYQNLVYVVCARPLNIYALCIMQVILCLVKKVMNNRCRRLHQS